MILCTDCGKRPRSFCGLSDLCAFCRRDRINAARRARRKAKRQQQQQQEADAIEQAYQQARAVQKARRRAA